MIASAGFIGVTALPVIALTLGGLWGGAWAGVALVCLTLLNQAADAALSDAPDRSPAHALRTALPVALGLIHFPLFALAIWSIALAPHGVPAKIALFFAFGLYLGSVSNGVGHELIHRTARLPFTLGKWIFISHLFGHHTSAHRLVHHPYVATPFDPNTPRFGESFYRFFRRAWIGSFDAGLSAENTRRGLNPDSRDISVSNPYFTYIVGGAVFAGLALGLAGIPGLLTYFGLAVMAQGGLLVTDYIQHYGLQRAEDDTGRFEPVGPQHSWNAPHWFTRKLTLNAPLHSDHHWKPARPFTELAHHPTAPQLPYSPGVMSLLALIPRRWRKVMNPRVHAIRNRPA